MSNENDYLLETKKTNQSDDKYPKVTILILLNVLFEGVSFYGIRNILYIYLTEFLELSDDSATGIYHVFAVICYFTPFFGAIVSGS